MPVPDNWHGKLKLKDRWLPLWCLNTFEDWIEDVFFNEFQDADANSIKYWEDDTPDVVPDPDDIVWNEPKDLEDPVEDWPKDVEKHPPEAPDEIMKPEEEAEDHPED
jgi:hypothetical protein